MTELWMAAITPAFRKLRLGELMFIEVLASTKAKNILARCSQKDGAAARILRKLGFQHYATGAEGSEFLVTKQFYAALKASRE